MGSLVIIPAATAKYLARSLDGMLAISVTMSVTSTVAGEALASRARLPTGPVIIAIAAAVFLAGLFWRRRR